MISSRLMMKYTISIGTFIINAAMKPNGTVMHHIVTVSHSSPNLLSPPALNIPAIVVPFTDFPIK